MSTDRRLQQKLRVSFIAASALSITALVLCIVEAMGFWKLVNPFFWLPIAIGSFGVAGSNLIYLRGLQQSQ